MKFVKIDYKELNSRQQETYNFQQVSAILADYGFATIKLNDDWQGADFIAWHIDGYNYLKIQLKGRLTFDKKYIGKNIYICFPDPSDPNKGKRDWYLFDHDELLNGFFLDKIKNTLDKEGYYCYPRLTKEVLQVLSGYKL